jgi:glucosamine--fructose-6-phosphate aminotransferase (isomerizing)
MCGIICFNGNIKCINFLLNGLKQLQNRGYDSAGICCIQDNQFKIIKFASTNNKNGIELIEECKDIFNNDFIGIGHTRWATHGAKTDYNAHPHIDNTGNFALVHNGIIENYLELKDFLIKNGYEFKSETDTEIIVNLISYNYNITKDTLKSIQITINELQGTWGLAILSLYEPNKIFLTRHGSPLLVGKTDRFGIGTSEQSGFDNKLKDYIVLNNEDICIIENNKELFIKTNDKYNLKKIENNRFDISPSPYKYWIQKEIEEQIDSSLRAISLGGRLLSNSEVRLGGLQNYTSELIEINNIIILGCGTSYHSGLLATYYFKDLCNFNTVQVFDGAEFTNKDIPKIGKTAVIFLSQSGETKDLHRCIDIANENNLFMIGVVNVVDSMIAREVHCGVYINAGREVSVASTKAFSGQVIILSMIAIYFSQIHDINKNKRLNYIKDLKKLIQDIEKTLIISRELMNVWAEKISKNKNLFILGKGKAEAIAKEGSLKIKEISYIHAEGYSTSSLKHGPFGLLEKDFPCIFIINDDNFINKNINAIEEVNSRLADIFIISSVDNFNLYSEKNIINIPNNKTFGDLLSVIPLQYLAYYLAIQKNYNPDYPRNLAKVVTVE